MTSPAAKRAATVRLEAARHNQELKLEDDSPPFRLYNKVTNSLRTLKGGDESVRDELNDHFYRLMSYIGTFYQRVRHSWIQ